MNIQTIILEEIKRLFEQEIYSIPELSQLLKRLGHDDYGVSVLEKILFNAYRKNGDEGVIDTFIEMGGVEIQAVRNGRYIFANLFNPEEHEFQNTQKNI